LHHSIYIYESNILFTIKTNVLKMEFRLEKRENIITDKWIYPGLSVSQQQDSTGDKMMTKGFHSKYFVMFNTECQDILLYGNRVQDLASLCCTYKEVQSFKNLNA